MGCVDHSNDMDDAGCRPVVVVSSCLLGEPVRYDGGECRFPWLTDVLSNHCQLLPVCPEMAAGLGVPRPPVRLQEEGTALKVVGVDEVSLDVTERLQQTIDGLLDSLSDADGLILKSRSPSCALADAPRFSASGAETGHGPGLFALACRKAPPGLPIIDEQGLASEAGKVGFLIQVFRYRCRRQGIASAPGSGSG